VEDPTSLIRSLQELGSLLTEQFQAALQPGVWLQLAAMAGIIAIAWLLSQLTRRLQRRVVRRMNLVPRLADRTASVAKWLGRDWSSTALQKQAQRGLRFLERAHFPILGLLLTSVVIGLLQWAWDDLAFMSLLVAGYRLLLFYWLLIGVLYVVFPEEDARAYDRSIVRPLLVAIVTLQLGVTLITAAVVLYLGWALGRAARHFLNTVLIPRTHLESGVGNTLSTLTAYTIVSLGIIVALGILGVDLASLVIVLGGLAVGIGFGLQKLVSNFVSGLILLFDQSIRPGDVVEVAGDIGVVENLQIRATTVRTYDNIEVVVPNENLLTSSVVTHTRSDQLERVRLPVGVSYKSDPTEVREALLAAGRSHDLVLADPAPTVFFIGYGDSSIDFELAVWIANPIRIPEIRSDLYFAMWDELKQRGIEIPFPQRDLHLRSGIPWETLYPDKAAPGGG
jgi:small-conductance mechanosensitive channel